MQLYQLQQHQSLVYYLLVYLMRLMMQKQELPRVTSAITANTAKNTNVTTDLSISGTTGARTIESSDGTDATTSVSGYYLLMQTLQQHQSLVYYLLVYLMRLMQTLQKQELPRVNHQPLPQTLQKTQT